MARDALSQDTIRAAIDRLIEIEIAAFRRAITPEPGVILTTCYGNEPPPLPAIAMQRRIV